MSVDEFIKDIEEEWQQSKEPIPAGPGKPVVAQWFDAYGEAYTKATSG